MITANPSVPSITLAVIAPGADVTLWGDVKARVTSVMVEDGGSISYRVRYWAGGTLNDTWVTADMIADGRQTMRVGFAAANGRGARV